uniref:Spike glycoprotein n=1 Tax=Human coronavirus HKU1 TaxID=290028 RepID=A0A7G1CW27_CVHK1|nr:spike glycoprotein [Human coronavirus HKU1]
MFLIIFILPTTLAVIGDFNCTNSFINHYNKTIPRISEDVVDVSLGLGTYYVLNRVYLNTTLLFTGYFPKSGANFRDLALKGSTYLSTLWYKPPFLSDFNNGIFSKVKNTKLYVNNTLYSEFSTIVIGSVFVNTSYTIVVQPHNGILEITACQYTMCEYPHTVCKSKGSIRNESWHIDSSEPLCLFKKNFTYNVSADWLYFHFYQERGVFYAYYADVGMPTTFLFSLYLGTILSHYYVMPLTCNAISPKTDNETLEYWVTPLSRRQYLLNFDEHGVITNAVDCSSSFLSEIQCKTQSFAPNTGVYDLSGFTVKPVATVYRRIPNLPDCDIDNWLNNVSVPSPLNWERRIFSNCNFNLSTLLRLVHVDSFSCNNLDKSKIFGSCFNSITVDKFAIPNRRRDDLQLGSSGFLQSSNYKIDISSSSCQLYYSLPLLNVTINNFNPSSWNRRYGFGSFNVSSYDVVYSDHCFSVNSDFCPCADPSVVNSCVKSKPLSAICPAGTKYRHCDLDTTTLYVKNWCRCSCLPDPISTYSPNTCPQKKVVVGIGEHCPGLGINEEKCGTQLNHTSCSCSPDAFLGWSFDSCISNNRCNIFSNFIFNGINSGTTCSNDLLYSNTEVSTGVCVNYDLYGITGQGIFKEVSAAYYNNWQNLLYDSNGNIIGFKDFLTNKTYTILPCYSGRVSAAFYQNSSSPALLYRNLKCSYVLNNISFISQPFYFDSYLGCVLNAVNLTSYSVSSCDLRMGSGFCIDYALPSSRRKRRGISSPYRFVTFEPFNVSFVNDSVETVGGLFEIQIPTNFTIAGHEEFIQTSSPKVTIDCSAFVCSNYAACHDLLSEYGTFCDNINSILNEVNDLLDITQLQVANALMQGVTLSSNLNTNLHSDVDNIDFKSLLGCLGSQCGSSSRSLLEDFIFKKVKLSDVGFVEAYNNCTGGSEIRDLLCVQSFNGIKVLPPILSESQISGYTTAATVAAMFPPWSAAAGIPFSLNVQYRINGLGVTMDVLNKNQKLIATAFNNALLSIQNGFSATNSALAKIQSVVNSNAQALNSLLQQLFNKFGAISSSLQEILSRLDALEAQVQIDRLINGRLTALNAYVSQQLSDISLVKFGAALAMEKVNECVKSQSPRINFCGNGNHILSLVQNAPYGLLFMHFSYKPISFKTVLVSPGLCLSGDRGIAPKQGYFIKQNDSWMFTGSSYYYPEPISDKNVVFMNSCSVNFTKAPFIYLNNSIPNLSDFEAEFSLWFKNHTSIAPNLTFNSHINATFLDLYYEMNVIQESIKSLNSSFINLKEIGTYEMYVKWPWYIWLLIVILFIIFLMILFFICCCTGCGSACFSKCHNCCDEYGGHNDFVIKASHDD